MTTWKSSTTKVLRGGMNNLQQGLVTYIGYYRKNDKHKFSYEDCTNALHGLGLSCKPTTLRKEFSVLKKQGLIDFKTYYRKPYPVLTQAGRLFIKTRLPFRHYGTWDAKWRLVIFDIPEKERKYRQELRQKLLELGFGQIQNSVYISPHPVLAVVSRLTRDWGIRQFVKLMEVSKLDDENKIALKAWKLDEINEKYHEFIESAKKTPRDNYWVFRAKMLEHQFTAIYETDPHLPAELLHKTWQGEEAYKLFKEISNSY